MLKNTWKAKQVASSGRDFLGLFGFGLGDFHLHSWRHGGRESEAFDFGAAEGFGESLQVLDKFLVGLAGGANLDVENRGLFLGSDLELAAFELFFAFLRIGGDGFVFGVGHEAAGPENFGMFGEIFHDVGGGEKDVEIDLAFDDLGDELGVGDGDFDLFACRMGEFDLKTR